MTSSNKTKQQLLTELKKLQKELDRLKKSAPAASKAVSSLRDLKWESFFRNSVNAIIVVDRKGKILDVNRVEGSYPNGKNPIGRSAFDFVAKDAVKEMKAALAKVFATGKTQEYNTWRVDEKGKAYYYKSRAIAISENKKVVAAVIDATEITNEIEAQFQLKQNEERFKKLSDSSFEGIVIHQHGKVAEVNRATCQMFGYTEKEISGQSIFKFIHPDYHELAGQQLKTKSENRFEMVMLSKGKKPFWAELMASEIIHNNAPARVVAIRDITKNKEYEKQIRESEERFRMLAQNAVDVVFRYALHPTYRQEYISPSIEQLTGYPQQQFYRDPQLGVKIIHPEDVHIVAAMQMRKKGKKSGPAREGKPFVVRWIRKDGSIIWTETVNKPIYDEKGKLVAVEGISRDITERKEQERQLLESEEKFRMLAENASDLIYRYRLFPSVKYEYVSPSALQLTGYSPEEFYAQPMLSFRLIHPADVHLLGDSEKLIREKAKLSNVKGPELILRWIKKDGSVIWTETRNKPIFDANKRLVAIEGISRDITLQKQNEDALRDSEERFKLLSNATFEGIVFSENGVITDANDQFVEMYGYNSSAEVIGKSLIDDFVVDEQKAMARRFVRLSKSEPYEVQTFKKDGSIITVETKNQNIPYFGKKIRATVIYNITERKQYESSLRESERTLSTLMNNLPGMAYRCSYDDRWTMRFVSKGFQDLTGYNPKDIINNKKRSFSDIIHPEDRNLGKKEIDEALRNQSTFEIEYRLITASGEAKWVWEKGEGVFGEDGKLLFLEGFITDVNEKKQYDLELRQSRENYKSLVDYSPDGVFIHIDGKVVFANPSALKLAEISDVESAWSYTLFDFLLPEYHEQVVERIKMASAGTSQGFIEVKIKALTGEIKEVETKPILIKFNGRNAILTVVHDISTQKQLLKEQARAQIAEETNELLEQEITERKVAQLKLQESQKYTRLLINSSLDMICASDRNGYITEFNAAAQRTFGYDMEEIIGKHVSVLYADPEQRIKINEQELYTKGVFAGEVLNVKRSGEKFVAYLSASVLKNEQGQVVGAMGVSRDISELKKAEQELRESEEKYRAIYEQAFIGIAKVSTNTVFEEVNEQLCNILGYSREELTGKSYQDIVAPDSQYLDYGGQLFSGSIDRANFERKYLHKNGSIVSANVTVSVVKNIDGEVTHFIAVFQDVTESVKANEAMLAQSAKFNAIIESSSHVIWTVDKDICLTTFNENYARQQKKRYGIDARVGFCMVKGDAVSTQEYNNFWIKKYESAFAGYPQHFETQFFEKDGTETWREVYLNPIFDKEGLVHEVSGIGHDITEKKISEEKIRQQLQEKEVLLKEVHHRVKNNLQVISSILNLQSSYVKDEGTLNILKESQNRIKSMAFIHESLYQTKDFSSINFTEYVINLSQNLIHSYSNFDHEIKLNLDIQNVFLNLDLAIPCGLIINEIVSNALKYAFVDNSMGGEISISMKIVGEELVLRIGDNGKGLPKHIDYRNTESLGLQLVVTLTDQLSGSIDLDLEKGTNYTIVFKQNQVKNRI